MRAFGLATCGSPTEHGEKPTINVLGVKKCEDCKTFGRGYSTSA
jgi:hypothetical protein